MLLREFYENHSLHAPLTIELMMYGKKKRTRTKLDKNGERIFVKMDAKGKPVWEKEPYYENVKKGEGKGTFPSVNAIYRRGRNGRPEYTAMAIAKFEEWATEGHLWRALNNWVSTEEKVYMDFYFYLPNDKIRRDTHNVFKICCDAFNKIIYEDDFQCMPRVMDYCKVEEGVEPYIEIFIHTQSEMEIIYEKTFRKET